MPVKMTFAMPDFTKGAHAGLQAAGEHILAESQKIVPLKEATLARSGTVTTRNLETSISYNTIYAVRQHEELDWQHDEGRQAKYLETPLNAEADTVMQIIADHIKDALQ